jgi:predicted nucleic acid-binding protein
MNAPKTIETISIFIDSSVLMAASISERGSANDLMRYAEQKIIKLYFSQVVFDETEKNLTNKAPRGLPRFQALRAAFAGDLVAPTQDAIDEVAKRVEPKDAPIVAAALAAGSQYLATYDQRHLLRQKDQIHSAFQLSVATPADVLLLLGLAVTTPEGQS